MNIEFLFFTLQECFLEEIQFCRECYLRVIEMINVNEHVQKLEEVVDKKKLPEYNSSGRINPLLPNVSDRSITGKCSKTTENFRKS